MHEINWRTVDLRLPAKVAFAAVAKGVESNLADEANSLRLAGPNDC